jgi:cyclopropane-fatty-acyl-phospholipid synthase
MSQKEKRFIMSLLKKPEITLNGDKPYDIIIHNKDLYKRVLSQGSLGVGEAYMDGWWDSKELDRFFYRLFKSELEKKIINWRIIPYIVKVLIFNLENRKRAFKIGEKHYDIGNDLYKVMLDKRMVYTCGYWKTAKTLDDAQEDKLNLVCRKLSLKPGMKVLDIGCGWGSFAKFAAENYGVHVTGVTVSKNQVELGRKLCKDLPVDIQFKDYREVEGEFDAIVSLGMFEHVGYRNYRVYMRKVHKLLKDDGLFLLHTIGGNSSMIAAEPWFDKYIFPGGMLPSIKQIGKSIEGLFVMEDWHNFGIDYDKTLIQWFKNFDSNWGKIKDNYDMRFYRMWKYYLLVMAGAFRARKNQLWQIVLSKKPTKGYERVC